VMAAVSLRTDTGWFHRFLLLQVLAVVIAVMGMSLDSSAVVIGAMLVAPLMAPLMGVAAAAALAMPSNLARTAVVVAIGAFGSVVTAFVLAALLPDGELTAEVLARTAPDLRDLVVAIAAGAAGSFATVREDVSSALPGVAVAVALVPPLGAIGMTLEAGRPDLAEGAGLLFATNLVAIVAASIVVFLLSGFVPERLSSWRRRRAVMLFVVTPSIVAVAIPLGLRSVAVADGARERRMVEDVVRAWLGSSPDQIDNVRLTDDGVRVELSGPVPPPPAEPVSSQLEAAIGRPVSVDIRWTETRAVGQPDGGSAERQLPMLTRTAAEAAVRDWLADGGGDTEILGLDLELGQLVVRLRSTRDAPPSASLERSLRSRFADVETVRIDWTRREQTDAVNLELLSRVQEIVDQWVEATSDARAEQVTHSGRNAIDVTIAAPGEPDLAALRAELDRAVPDDVRIDFWFVRRERVGTVAGPGG